MFELQPFRKGAISKKDFFTNFFDNIFDEDFSPAGVFGSSFKVDVRENEKNYTVDADLPGFKKEDVDVSYKDNYLTIKAKREEEKKEEKEEERTEATEKAALEKELEEEKAKNAELNDRYLRLLAEYDNFKKRTLREKEELYFSSQCEIIKKLLPVFDNLERAENFTDNDQFVEGVKMIFKQFFEVLTAMGIAEIAAKDLPFDPQLHEAICRDEKEGVPENTVTEVLQKGYLLKDKVIRHAMVKVSN